MGLPDSEGEIGGVDVLAVKVEAILSSEHACEIICIALKKLRLGEEDKIR